MRRIWGHLGAPAFGAGPIHLRIFSPPLRWLVLESACDLMEASKAYSFCEMSLTFFPWNVLWPDPETELGLPACTGLKTKPAQRRVERQKQSQRLRMASTLTPAPPGDPGARTCGTTAVLVVQAS